MILIRGGGDLGSGVALRLARVGLRVLVTELPQPMAVRRLVSFAQVVYSGELTLEGVQSHLAASLDEASVWMDRGQVAVLVDPDGSAISACRPLVMIDARMRKLPPEISLEAAPLVIGLGPGFTAGFDCHAVIETKRGPFLGRVIWEGSAEADTGLPDPVAQRQGERVLRAPAAGVFTARKNIGEILSPGQEIAEVAGQPIHAPFPGVLRGLLQSGIRVSKGIKVGDIDPRMDPRLPTLVSDKALAVGGGALEAVLTRAEIRRRLWERERPMDLAQALRLLPFQRLAVVGSGGKTSAVFQLARSLPGPVWVTTSTHLGIDQVIHADRHLTIPETQSLPDLEAARAPGVTVITGPRRDEFRVAGMDASRLLALRDLASRWQIPFLIEADGARGLPLKAPGGHEPAIPPWVDRVLVCAGISGLDRPLAPEWVHRPERFAELSGIPLGEPVTLDGLAKVLSHPQGGLKNIPPSTSRSLLLNQADDLQGAARAGDLARRLVPIYSEVIIASLRARLDLDWADPAAARIHSVHSRVAEIVLAAGESKRLGRAKQTLEWRGEPLVRQVARLALQAGLSPVVVVTGAVRDAVEQAVAGLGVTCVTNAEWALGQSSSLQAGLRALPPETRALLFLLCDQPQIPVDLIVELVDRHARTLAPCVVPWVGDRRANPVLFDSSAFPDLLKLQGDTGGRALFGKYARSIEKVPWADETILLDIDTEEDYQRLQAL